MHSWLRRSRGSLLVGFGYLLSPLSWWNDLVFNLPIALVVGYGVSWLRPDWMFAGTLVGYWLSNVLGMLLLQFGTLDLISPGANPNLKQQLGWGLGGSTVYTLMVGGLVYFHILELPDFLRAPRF